MKRIALLGLLVVPGVASAQFVFNESEPNNTRETANQFNGIQDVPGSGLGSRMNGNATGTDVDRFRLGVAGTNSLQQNSFTINRPTNDGGLYARSITAAGTIDTSSDVLVQPTRPLLTAAFSFNSFLTVGEGTFTETDYRIAGVGGDYTSTYSRFPITPGGSDAPSVGTFRGAFTITAGSQTIDSDIALIGNPLGSGATSMSVLKANNDASANTRGSRIFANYAFGGDFYLAITDVNLVSGLLPDADEFARGANDPRTHVFPSRNVLAASSAAEISIPFTITDETGYSITTTFNKSAYGLGVYKFTVLPAPVPEPATMAALCLGALGLLKRRRKG